MFRRQPAMGMARGFGFGQLRGVRTNGAGVDTRRSSGRKADGILKETS